MKPKKQSKEMRLVMSDVREHGLGIYDPKLKKRIDATGLCLMWDSDAPIRVRKEFVLLRDLAIVKKIYKEKFGAQSPYDLALFEKDPGLFAERLIRAVEICTLNYVLNKGGALNKDKNSTIIKGRKKFVWEF